MRKTTEQYKKEVYELVGNEYMVLGKYINNSTRILMLHVPYNHTFSMTPQHFLRGNRCPYERKQRIAKHRFKLTIQEIQKRINSRLGDQYVVIGKQVIDHRIKIKHLKCGYTWMANVGHIIKDTACPYCGGVAKKNTSIFRKEVYKLVGDEYQVKSKYINARTPLKMLHTKCGHTFKVSPDDFLRGSRCPYERGERIRIKQSLTTDEFKQKLDNKFPHQYQVLEKYINNHTPIKIKHLNCGNEFVILPYHLLERGSCPYCRTSVGENLVADVLKNVFNFIPEVDFKHGLVLPNRLHLDFYLPKQQIAIEYDGAQHYRPVKWFGGKDSFDRQQVRDKLKDQYCKDQGIKLIRIPYTVTTVNQTKEILSKYIPDQIDQNDQDTANLDQNKQ